MLAISDPEPQLPTLTMSSDQLAGISGPSDPNTFSLSGIIKECGMYLPDQQQNHHQNGTITVEAGTVPGQDQGFTFQLVPQQQQQQQPRDVMDNLRGFPQQQQQQQQQDMMQCIQISAPPSVPLQPSVEIVEQPASHKLRFR